MPGLSLFYVAFIDILGFSNMVEEDADNPSGNNSYLKKLHECHQQTVELLKKHENCSLTQFSDAVVIARPFNVGQFLDFVAIIASYQRLLLENGLLCRGGVAFGEHYAEDTFMFSRGVIRAYELERDVARYPRVVISNDIMDLLFPEREFPDDQALVFEDDGLVFVNYLGEVEKARQEKISACINTLVSSMCADGSASVREKGRWLAAYSDAMRGTALSTARFNTKSPVLAS